jgi:hypothetical protein
MGAGAIPIDIEKAFKERAKNKHKLTVYMADEGYEGEGKIDVSFYGGDPVFTLPKQQQLDYKTGKLSKEKLQQQYFKFLESSFIQYQYTWDKLLDSGKVVLVCSCNAKGRNCHRYILVDFLKKFGAVFKGRHKG